MFLLLFYIYVFYILRVYICGFCFISILLFLILAFGNILLFEFDVFCFNYIFDYCFICFVLLWLRHTWLRYFLTWHLIWHCVAKRYSGLSASVKYLCCMNQYISSCSSDFDWHTKNYLIILFYFLCFYWEFVVTKKIRHYFWPTHLYFTYVDKIKL